MTINMDLIFKILQKKKIEYKPLKTKRGEQIAVKCPKCGKKKLFVNVDKSSEHYGLWNCKTCQEDGNYYSLFKHLGEDYKKYYKPKKESGKFRIPKESYLAIYKKNLMNSRKAKHFLTKVRRFKKEACLHFQLGVKVDKDDRQWIALPYIKNGMVVNYKYRAIDSKEFRREEGCESILYGLDECDPSQPLIIVEGEFDRIGAWHFDLFNVAATTIGAGGFDDAWISELKPFKEIILCYDADGKGRLGAEKVSKLLGKHRCKYVQLPFDDMCHCLEIGMSKEEMQELFEEPKNFEIDEIKHFSDLEAEFDTEFSDKEENIGIETGYVQLDNMLRGIRMGELTVVTGHTAGGKTTWTTHLAKNMVEKIPVMIASFEMKKGKIFKKLIQMYAEKEYEELTPDEYNSAKEIIFSKDLYILDKFGNVNLEMVKEIITYAKHKLGIKLIILDHLRFFCNGKSHNEVQDQSNIMIELKTLSIDLDVHIMLIAHPHKLDVKEPVRMVDIKGASSIYQDVDNFLSIFVNPEQRKHVTVIVEKNREYSKTGDCVLLFDDETFNYENVREFDAIEED